jgi:hypothetical protein
MIKDTTVKAIGLAFDAATRDWTKPVEYIARNRMEAINWMHFNKNYMKDLKIVENNSDQWGEI